MQRLGNEERSRCNVSVAGENASRACKAPPKASLMRAGATVKAGVVSLEAATRTSKAWAQYEDETTSGNGGVAASQPL